MTQIGFYTWRSNIRPWMVVEGAMGVHAVPPELQSAAIEPGPRLLKRKRAAEIKLRRSIRAWAREMDAKIIEGLGL